MRSYMPLHLVHRLYYAGMTSHLDIASGLAGGGILQRSLRCPGLLTLGGGPSVYWQEGFGLVLLHAIIMTVPATVRGM